MQRIVNGDQFRRLNEHPEVVGRVAVFCYWWVARAWQDEKCQHGGGHHFMPVIPNKNPGEIPGKDGLRENGKGNS